MLKDIFSTVEHQWILFRGNFTGYFFSILLPIVIFFSIILLNFVAIGTFLPIFICRHELLPKISQIIQSL